MSATIEPFPLRRTTPLRGAEISRRYARRAQEAYDLLAVSRSELECQTLCDIAEIWLDMAEAALPAAR